MKKQLILFVSIMFVATINANNFKTYTSNLEINNRYNDAVTFVERGIKFHIFLNGDFDFNAHRNNNYGVKIERNRRGKVRRIGNVFINYDYKGNVKRIGNVFMNYRFGQLIRVGNLYIKYDRWGNPNFRGSVQNNRYYYQDDYDNNSCSVDVDISLGDVYDYDDVYFYRRNFKRNHIKIREDNNFYYYRSKLGRKNKIIKRRKQQRKKAYRRTKRSRR